MTKKTAKLASNLTEKSDGVFDAVIVGAGIAGMYMLYRLRERGLSTLVIEGLRCGGNLVLESLPRCPL